MWFTFQIHNVIYISDELAQSSLGTFSNSIKQAGGHEDVILDRWSFLQKKWVFKERNRLHSITLWMILYHCLVFSHLLTNNNSKTFPFSLLSVQPHSNINWLKTFRFPVFNRIPNPFVFWKLWVAVLGEIDLLIQQIKRYCTVIAAMVQRLSFDIFKQRHHR